MLTNWLTLMSASLEIVGVLLMANAYFKIAETGLEKLARCTVGMFAALWRGDEGRYLAKSAEIANEESKITTLQGLGFVALGFIIQAGNSVYVLISKCS